MPTSTTAENPERQDETHLLLRLRRGDESAFAEMVLLYGPRLLAVARRLLRNEDDSRDAVQDAFLSAFKSLERFQGDARLTTWLHRIVVNAGLMKLRTRRRKPEESIEDLLPRFQEDGHQLDPAVLWNDSARPEAASLEIRLLVRRNIDRLPEGYRTVLLLRDIEGYDTEDAARALGISANAVKVRLHRARQGLRTLLDPSFREGPQ
ncbi:MAG: sigma-70 family RNA polymerase sigma factor [Candidatus Eisenbacteria bacterium]|nr:sigma-70 family RNA polymerase sigma factor [Candidatus Eisenbacteria bacterium]